MHARASFGRARDLVAGHVTFKIVPPLPGSFVPVCASDVEPHVREHGILEDTLAVGPQKGKPDGMGLRKGAILQPARPGRAFKGLGGAKRYCRKDAIGDNFTQGAMTKYWVFTQGGAWRNLKPTGTAYVCEQIRLDARSGNDANLTLEAVTTRESCSKVPKLGAKTSGSNIGNWSPIKGLMREQTHVSE